MDLIVIHNAAAGAGKWRAKSIEKLLRDAGHTVRMESTKQKWRQALDEEPDAFVAAGGDGTVQKVLRALEDRAIPVAILPTGTANNVAHALGFNTGDDFVERVARWQENERWLHLARVEKRGKRRTFVEAVGFGAFAQMVSRAGSGEGERSAPDIAIEAIRNFLAKELRKTKPVQVAGSIDGIEFAGEYLLLECLNLPYLGPRLRLAPDEQPDAPTVTVCGIPIEAREETARCLESKEGVATIAELGRGSHVHVSSDAGAHVDGAPWPRKNPRGGRLRIKAGAQTMRVWI
jgi:diacylglycerol kinase family enzyme